jgi:phosphoglycolate phosphatase-like HAD superfamily hydrolase
MVKPILATNIDGFLINHKAFIEPHRVWFDRAILLTKDFTLGEWKGKENYFVGVNKAMEKILPDASKEERTTQARTWYQEDVVYYIQTHPEVINKKLKEVLIKLKEKFTLALITTNTREYISEILKASNLNEVYDIILASSSEEEPNKTKIFQEFKQKYSEPKYYIASRSKEAFEECTKIGSICIYFAQDEIDSDIKKIANKTITKISELPTTLK